MSISRRATSAELSTCTSCSSDYPLVPWSSIDAEKEPMTYPMMHVFSCRTWTLNWRVSLFSQKVSLNFVSVISHISSCLYPLLISSAVRYMLTGLCSWVKFALLLSTCIFISDNRKPWRTWNSDDLTMMFMILKADSCPAGQEIVSLMWQKGSLPRSQKLASGFYSENAQLYITFPQDSF
jgi:hypothetical protein